LATAHEFFEVIWIIRGRGWIWIDDEKNREEMVPGAVRLIAPGTYRQYGSEDLTWECRWFTLVGERACELVELFSKGASQLSVGECPVGEFERLRELLLEGGERGTRESLQVALRILSALVPVRSRESDFLRWVTKRIEDNLGSPSLNVEWLAQELGVHRSSLSRRFHRENGVPLVKYITSRRLERAMQLLRNGPDRVQDVARACGFADPDYFSRVFRRRVGRSPRQFRQESI
jgi:AraC-like DNA-binding protein